MSNESYNFNRIKKLYQEKKLSEETDEKGAGGYWDLAGDIATSLVPNKSKHDDILYEQLQEGFYQVFQKVLVKGEKYE